MLFRKVIKKVEGEHYYTTEGHCIYALLSLPDPLPLYYKGLVGFIDSPPTLRIVGPTQLRDGMFDRPDRV